MISGMDETNHHARVLALLRRHIPDATPEQIEKAAAKVVESFADTLTQAARARDVWQAFERQSAERQERLRDARALAQDARALARRCEVLEHALTTDRPGREPEKAPVQVKDDELVGRIVSAVAAEVRAMNVGGG